MRMPDLGRVMVQGSGEEGCPEFAKRGVKKVKEKKNQGRTDG